MKNSLFTRVSASVFLITSLSLMSSVPLVALASASGINGVATLSPGCPGFAELCPDQPYVGFITIKSADDGMVVAEVETDENGLFSVELDPGVYLLEQGGGDGMLMGGGPVSFFPTVEQDATVVADEFTEVSLVFDSGLR